MNFEELAANIDAEFKTAKEQVAALEEQLQQARANLEKLGGLKATLEGNSPHSPRVPRKAKQASGGGWSGTPQQIALRREIVQLGQKIRHAKGTEKAKLQKEKESLQAKLAELRKS